MQALKMFQGGGGNSQGGQGGQGGQAQMMGMAMQEASKLFDQQSSQGNVASKYWYTRPRNAANTPQMALTNRV